MARKKSWVEKRENLAPPQLEITSKAFAGIPAGVKMFIATPKMVDEKIRKIPRGSSGTAVEIREMLAAENGADYSCPLTTGIFIRIAAEAAWEELQQGQPEENITPFWRVIAPGSKAADKLSFGKEFLIQKQKEEGIF